MKHYILYFVLLFTVLSCGSPKTLVRVSNKAEGTTTEISVSQGSGGSTTVSVTPDISLDIVNPKDEK